jgi:hypothetical protein
MVQKAKYDVVRKLGKLELRHYGPLVVARAEGSGNGGFDRLFRYIRGNNRQHFTVDMTAPLITEGTTTTTATPTGSGSMAFVMPSGYNIETIPMPLDPGVMIVEVPARFLGVLRFRGRWTEEVFERRSRELMGRLREVGLRTRGDVFAMLYNPPFMPAFLRRNEVAVEVDAD